MSHHHNPLVKKVLALFKKVHSDKEGKTSKYPPDLDAKYIIDEDVTLGVGSFAVVKQCVQRTTKEKCAVKIILKKAIADILTKVRHKHVVSLHDIYESDEAVYIVTDLCTGGELFQRIVERGTYTEEMASDLVRQMLEGLAYLHSLDLLFKTPAENADLLITDFGLSKLLKDRNEVLTTACGTPGYVAPEVLLGTGHGKPVDVWSVGVIMYTLLSGYTPFYGEDQTELFECIMQGKYEFEEEYWGNISIEAKNLIDKLLTFDPKERITAEEALQDVWITHKNKAINLAPNVRKGFNSRKTLRSLVTAVAAMNRLKLNLEDDSSSGSDNEKEKDAH
ncbi:kinase-like domain-containing protein [Mycotypha africana]|uniref:kinase-like domain-containing protein n=1 Tax=Mycotypha africana TaxID=64632 RepID=UPI0022FFC90E|nr:kinase-like domain-containing protein [Mycotypha africana]KAI8969255.1 kinase-like domain-containing protein [Mycotypha africana]